jgi:glycosyltransferase involved in cell wall biosynthesis
MALIGISLVTPSFNRKRFLAAAMESVLSQQYENLEYVLVDGGSTDGSAELVASYAPRLTWWASEPDQGQYHAINKGFTHTSCEVMGWLNSDDLQLPWTLSVIGELFASFPEIEWMTSSYPLIWNERGQAISCSYRPGYSRAGFLRGEFLPAGEGYATGYIQQESTFWRRSLWERVGGSLDTSYRVAADFDLWMRFNKHAELYAVDVPLAGYRTHDNQRTVSERPEYEREAVLSFERHGGRRYGKSESLAMRGLVSHLPVTLRKLGTRTGLLSRRLACVNHGRGVGWRIEER